MEAVKAFNSELSSLYEVKPPISKAKMTAITRGAIKAIKFYKHVVQSVEKFILKCKPEYKVPGLYVIDSIVRQSRHQFGTDKDVFAPRFAKNMQQTFINLFKCPPEDKSKIIRVLNLWQKNQVFQAEVIQPLFDLADPNHPIHKEMIGGGGAAATSNNGITTKGSPALQKTPTKIPQQGSDATTLHLGGVSNNPTLLNADPNVLAQLQQLHRWIVRAGGDSAAKAEGPPVHFDKKLLDYDYGDDEEEATNPSPKVAAPNANDSVSSLLSNPEVLRHLQTLQQSELDLEKLRKLQEMKQQEEEFDKHLAQTVPNLPFASECEFKPTSNNVPPGLLPNSFFMSTTDVTQPPPNFKPNYDVNQQQDDSTVMSESNYPNNNSNDNGDIEVITLDHGDSRSGSPREDRYRRRRSRSRSRERRRSRRSRSRSHSRSRRHRTRSRDREREKEREKEKERKKRGLPPIKKEHLSVCSTTLWVGHLSKLVHQEELSDTFGEFGDVVSIDLIPPRGCAFIIMHRRQDAARCLTKLKNYKLQGKAITVAWAPGKGVKGKDLKDYWEGDLGVSYVPWSKLKPDIDLEMLEDGGMIDEDTMPDWLKERNAKPTDKPPLTEPSPSIDISQPPPVGQSLLGLPLVPPPFPGRVLGMNLMPNVPIGVPPPPTPTVLANQLLGIGSPFQAPPPPGLLQLPVEKPDEDGLVRFGMVQPPPLPVMHEDNMDVEMEDAERPRAGSLSEQLLASMDGGGDLQAAVNRLNAIANHRPNPGGLGSDLLVDEVGGGRRRSRSRGRDRDRLRGDGSRERMRDRSRGDRRGGNNRWGGVDRMRDRDDRREKTVNDRLREMAEGYTNHERPREELIPLPRPLPPPFALEPPPQPIIEDDRDDRYPMRPEFCHPDEYHHLEYDYRREQQQYEIGDRFLRARRADPFLEERREFEPRMPPDFYPGRDAFGGPRGPPLMRGMGPEGGGFMHRPPGMRPQRGGYRGGPMMRGARAPGWNDRSNSNFGPRFETPGDFYPRRFNDRSRERKRFRQDEVDVQDVRVEPEGGARRSSRWSSGSPRSKETEAVEEVVKVEGGCEENVKVATVVEGEEMGNTTPLHDEPLEKGAEPPTIVAVETDAAPVEVECETNATEITECN